MARKATDLLDVFRFGDEEDDARAQRDGRAADSKSGSSKGARRKKAAGKKNAKAQRASAAPGSRRRLESLILNRRQLVLAGSAMALLLMLSFVLGLSTGRPGKAAGDAAIQRTTPSYLVIRGTLPLLDPTTRKPIEPRHVADILKRDYGLRRSQLQMHGANGRLVIEVGPFPSEAQARDYLRQSGLEMMHLYMEDPFRAAEYAPWRSGR